MKIKVSEKLTLDTENEMVKRQGLRMSIIGESGSGKSWLIAVISEQAIQQGLQVVFFDVHGEYFTFREVFENFLVIGGENSDLPLIPEAVDVYVEAYRQGFSLDFNFRELIADEYEYGKIVEKIIRKLWKVQVNNPKPVLWIFEEAHLIAPQFVTKETVKRVSLVKSILTGGRKFGVMTILATQRPSELNKTPLSQTYIRFFGKLTEKLDRKAVEDYLKPLKSDVLKKLKTGEFYVYGWFEDPHLIKVTSKRITKHGAETPIVIPVVRRNVKVKESIEQLREMIQKTLKRIEEEKSERNKLLMEISSLKKQLEEERKEKKKLLEEIKKLETELDILSRLKGTDKMSIEKAIMEVKELELKSKPEVSFTRRTEIQDIKVLKSQIEKLKEENRRLREALRKREGEISLSETEQKALENWVNNMKEKIKDFTTTRGRKNLTNIKLLKHIISLDENTYFYPEDVAVELGKTGSHVAELIRQLRKMFKVGMIDAYGDRKEIHLVEAMKRDRRIRYRNNIKDYITTCIKIIIPSIPQTILKNTINEILSYIYSL